MLSRRSFEYSACHRISAPYACSNIVAVTWVARMGHCAMCMHHCVHSKTRSNAAQNMTTMEKTILDLWLQKPANNLRKRKIIDDSTPSPSPPRDGLPVPPVSPVRILISDSDDDDALDLTGTDAGRVAATNVLTPVLPVTIAPVPPMPMLISDSDDDDAMDLSNTANDAAANIPDYVQFQQRGPPHMHLLCRFGLPQPQPGPITTGPIDPVIGPIDPAVGPIDPLNLWKAVPPAARQFLDLSAKHASDSDGKDSFWESDESSLTDGFVSDNDERAIYVQHDEFMSKMLPHTYNRMKQDAVKDKKLSK